MMFRGKKSCIWITMKQPFHKSNIFFQTFLFCLEIIQR
mgnify:CR=1 FL=1